MSARQGCLRGAGVGGAGEPGPTRWDAWEGRAARVWGQRGRRLGRPRSQCLAGLLLALGCAVGHLPEYLSPIYPPVCQRSLPRPTFIG